MGIEHNVLLSGVCVCRCDKCGKTHNGLPPKGSGWNAQENINNDDIKVLCPVCAPLYEAHVAKFWEEQAS